MNVNVAIVLKLTPKDLFSCALMTQWLQSLAKYLKMFLNSLTMPHIMAQTISMGTALYPVVE